jgi:hypothetical protein
VSFTTSKRRKYCVTSQPENQNRTWDPGGGNPDPEWRNKLIKINVSSYIYSLLATVLVSDVDVADDNMMDVEEASRTELDSHANMPVVGRHVYIISHTGRVAEVNPFIPDYDSMEVPIVDAAAVRYECPYNGTSYILVIRNALYAPSMKNNLIPPFVMTEAGVKVNNVPKIHTDNPTVVDHSICFPETGFRIPMSLWGMFSYFPTSKPTTEIMKATEDVYLLTPSRWNPHCDAFASNEGNMLNWEGNMIKKKDRTQILLSEISEDTAMAASIRISSVESKTIDSVITRSNATAEEMVHPCWRPIPRAANEVSSMLTSLSPILDDQVLYKQLLARSDLGKFQTSIGSTNVMEGKYLVDDDKTEATQATTDDDESEMSDEATLDELFESVKQGEIVWSAPHTLENPKE